MFKKIFLNYKNILRYCVYLLILLNVLDIVSTYIGINYLNAYEANEKTAYLFDLFGMFFPSSLKIVIVLLLARIIKIIWDNSEFLLRADCGWMNSIAIMSILDIMFIIIFLDIVYLLIIANNIKILYN